MTYELMKASRLSSGSTFGEFARDAPLIWTNDEAEWFSVSQMIDPRLGALVSEFFPRRLDVFSHCHGAPRVVEVAAGREHSLFRLEDGSVLACGRNEKNQLGLGMRLGHALRRDTSGPCHDEWSSVVAPRLVHGPALEAARQLDPFARVLPWKVELAVRGKREELR